MHSKALVRSVLLVCLALSLAAAPSVSLEYAVVDIDGIGYGALQTLQTTDGIEWWVELDGELLVLAERDVLDRLARYHEVTPSELSVTSENLYFLRPAQHHATLALDVDVLARGGRFAVIQARGQAHDVGLVRTLDRHMELLPFRPDVVLARQWGNMPPLQAPLEALRDELRGAVQSLVDEVDPQRWFNDVTALAGYNRHTHGSEILDARDWLVLQFEALPGLSVTTQSFQVSSTTAFNVVGTLAGTARPDEWYIVGAHYDSTSENTAAAAPGAEDNASGCSGVLELARIFAAHPPEATVLFICYSGEEQGLFGSVDHASRLVAAGDDDEVQMMLNMDMIGFTEDADLDCLLETGPAFSDLLGVFGDAASLYTTLRIVTSLNPFGSDHVPYIARDMAALLTIENDWSSYAHYHRTTDLPAELSLQMGGEILRMNVAAMALMIGSASADAIFADGFESGDATAWAATSP